MKAFYLFLLLISAAAISQPVINSFTPVTGSVGTVVTIDGANFGTAPAANVVYFGGVRANVTTASAASITVIAPFGSMYAPISITSNALTGYSSTPFVTSFAGAPQLSSSSFAPKVDSGKGYWSNKVMLADLDGDERADIVNIHSTNKLSFQKNSSTNGVCDR